jgi:hypothetical protein
LSFVAAIERSDAYLVMFLTKEIFSVFFKEVFRFMTFQFHYSGIKVWTYTYSAYALLCFLNLMIFVLMIAKFSQSFLL